MVELAARANCSAGSQLIAARMRFVGQRRRREVGDMNHVERQALCSAKFRQRGCPRSNAPVFDVIVNNGTRILAVVAPQSAC